MESCDPVTAAEFGDVLARLGAARRVIVAVSGGPDSMALARLAAATLSDVLAVTVDHGLREGAGAEAEKAGRWCAAAGIEHRILRWEGAKPASGVQAAARSARYRLLAALAEATGAGAILTGHTADDQAETFFMRLARGAGPQGLAAMAPEGLIAAGPGAPARLLRPLLEFRRARILATLAAFKQPYIDDPSNDDPAFERIRSRALLAALEEQGLLTNDALLRAAARARTASARIEAEDAEAFNRMGGCIHAGGWITLSGGADAPASLVARLARAVSGLDHAPGEAQAAGAFAAACETGAATIGGAMLKRRGGDLFIFREPAALLGRAGVSPLGPERLAPGDRLLWDGRFILENVDGEAVEIAPMGPAGVLALGPRRALFDAPTEALETLPMALAGGSPSPIIPGVSGRIAAKSLVEERISGRVVRFS